MERRVVAHQSAATDVSFVLLAQQVHHRTVPEEACMRINKEARATCAKEMMLICKVG
jgi:hypothetical protein